MSDNVLLLVALWAGIGGCLYAYAAFPAIVMLLAARKSRTWHRPDRPDLPARGVTVIIPAFNEEKHLETKIRNVLGSDYPRALLDIIVVSDASTDRTNEIARGFRADGVRLIVQPRRRGKTAGLNRAVAVARGEIVVFTDANASYSPRTIATLVGYFDHPRTGLVTGYTRYTPEGATDVADATNMYTSLERMMKTAESRWGYCIGADGAIFAMRRDLYSTLRDDDINDFVLPLRVVDQGFACTFAEDACCRENAGKSVESEFRRQSRITNRTLRALWRHAHLLNPLRFPMFAFFLFSHKVARLLSPFFVALAAGSVALLAMNGGPFLAAFCVAAAAAAIALAVTPARRLLYIFLTVNVALLHGWWKFLSGIRDVTWQHDRAPEPLSR